MTTTAYAKARRNMVDGQLRTNKVTDEAVLAAVGELPREAFLPEPQRGIAYIDEDISLGRGRFLMEPMVMARLIQTAEIKPGDRVADIGCGCGYSSAVLARLAKSVIAVESDPTLAGRARANLQSLGIANVNVVVGAHEKGCAEFAPYDVIFIGGAIEQLPRAIVDQLAFGGRIVAVWAGRRENGRGMGEAVLLKGRPITRVALFNAATPVLSGFAAEPSFVF